MRLLRSASMQSVVKDYLTTQFVPRRVANYAEVTLIATTEKSSVVGWGTQATQRSPHHG